MPDIPVAHHTAVVNDVRLHYITAGQGEPVVLLHGWPQTWYQWRKIIPALAERYTVIAPDMRGLGDSSKPATGYGKRTVTAMKPLAEDVRGGEVDQCGHWIAEEQPEYLLAQLFAFFGEEG